MKNRGVGVIGLRPIQDQMNSQSTAWKIFDDASVLITGGTGSFGRNFIRTMLEKASPRRVAVLSRDELKQHEMSLAFAEHPKRNVLRMFIGDVRDLSRLEMAFRDIDYVIHAAALKHVPIAEYNPFECIHTNVLGAEYVVRAALRSNVKKVIALSTDKAANPINLYGASKLASDKIFVAANSLAGSAETRFSIVRYGNVLGSRGSVVPFFQKCIAEGAKDIPITDPRMTRFWITLEHGCEFVASSLASMAGGEIFVPKIPSMRLTELAKAMAPDLPHRIIGIRPGEKLHEIMITEDDALNTIELSDRYIIEPYQPFWRSIKPVHKEATRVPERFRYSSDTNSEWIDHAQLREMIGGMTGPNQNLVGPW